MNESSIDGIRPGTGPIPGVYPFRHFEDRFLPYFIAACVLAILAIRYAVITIAGIRLVAICFAISAIVGACIWFAMRKHFNTVMPRIVQGPKRIASLSILIMFCVGSFLSAGTLVANRHIPSGSVRYVDATVLGASKVVGPRVWGWDADLSFEGTSHYQMISAEEYFEARQAKTVRIGLQKGLLGYEYIVSLKARR
jgi:hypothetical protein